MAVHFNKISLLISCLMISILAHILSFYVWRLSSTYNFTRPVTKSEVVMVDLTKPPDAISQAISPEEHKDISNKHVKTNEITDINPTSPTNHEQTLLRPESSDTHIDNSVKHQSIAVPEPNLPNAPAQPNIVNSKLSPLGKPNDYLTTKNEKLTYVVSMLGLPIGRAELEAKNENGNIWITLRIKSNTAISSVYPVDDTVETRHIDGQFIMTNIKQQEGSFKSDEGFTINLRKKRVSWFDNLKGRSLTLAIQANDVLDTLSGIYYLRNRQLQIGKTETLHLYDSETYADVPVEILRRETLRLPNLTKIDTLVIRPLQKTAGIFRRTGDILIWMTDDAFRVPVKIVTSIALGEVTADLVSAESTPPE